MTNLVDAHIDAIRADLDRRRKGVDKRGEGEELSKHLFPFVRAAWHVLEPETPFKDNWHIGAMCDTLERITAGHVRKQLIWVPPGAMKTTTVTICWPTWEWTFMPWLRYLKASYDMDLAIEQFALPSRDLMLSLWFQERWSHVFQLKGDLNLKRSYSNDRGGRCSVGSPSAKKGSTGRHFDRIIIDDPSDAKSVEATSESELDKVITWHDSTLPTRFKDPATGVEVIVQQRLHERDLSGHIVESANAAGWEVLCLPYRYDPSHPFVWPDDAREPNELLWPERLDERYETELIATLGSRRAAGQLQQLPAAKEGEILKRAYWCYYDAKALEKAEEGDVSHLPPFRQILCAWDTSFKEKTSSDPVAGGIFGIFGGDRYLLRVFYDQASLSRTKTEMLALREWAIARWPRAGVRTLIEKKSNGVEIIEQLRRAIPGVVPYNPGNLDKTQRAEAAEPDLESGNVFIAGAPIPPYDELGRGPDYDPTRTPAWAQRVIDQCAAFPNAKNDDLVDMVTMALNWARTRGTRGARLYSPADMQMPAPAGIPTAAGSILAP